MQWNRVFSFEFVGKSVEIETTTWSDFSNEVKAIGKQILVSEEINKSKRAGLWESQSRSESESWYFKPYLFKDPSRKINHLSKVIWDLLVPLELVNKFLWWTLKSAKTNTLVDGLIERTSSMLDEIASKTILKDRGWLIEKKEVRH